MVGLLSKLSLRMKLLLGYSLTFLVSIVLGNLIIFMVVRHTIQSNIEKELTTSTNIIMNMVKSAADASIKNHLRAVSEKNRDIVKYYYDEYRHGKMSEEAAKAKAEMILLSQTIGKSGYIYCVDSNGVLKVHPKIKGSDLLKYDFIRRQIQLKDGYIEYEWANPGETVPRKKALYMTYFGPWDWIISVSSYREEFKELFNVNDFQDNILSISFGKTGYPYVMDSKGNLIIHPKLPGQNIFGSKDSNGREFIREMCEKKTGKISYPWKNPSEIAPREKLVIFNYIPEFDWLVASSSYLEEFNEPLMTIGFATFLTLIFVLLLVVPITWYISSSINRPVQEIMAGFSRGSMGDYSCRIETTDRSEIGRLAEYYNEFMEKLSVSSQNLHKSEEKFRLLFENAVEGVFSMDPEGRFLDVNPSMARLLGYESRSLFLREVSDMGSKVYVQPSEQKRLLSELLRTGTVTSFETTYRMRNGNEIWVSMNARAYMDDNGQITTVDGFCSDITLRKKSEDAQNRVKEELELRVAERTAELSDYIGNLEQRNVHESLLREMGELLQVCRQTSESYPIIDEYVKRFFPEQSGALYLFDSSRRRLSTVVSWGSPIGIEPEFDHEECWALRQGKVYGVFEDGQRLFCRHLNAEEDISYLCTPITAQGEIVGLFHLQLKETDNAIMEKDKVSLTAMARTFTENLGLALVNLQLQDKLREQSLKDPLTGLYNRRFAEEFAEQEMRRIKRNKNTDSLIIMIIDVDHFKRFNDTYGHDVGDLVLKEIAVNLGRSLRESDMVCRYGGEEFLIIMPACPLDIAVASAQKLCARVREQVHIRHKDEALSVTISIGIAGLPVHGSTIGDVIKLADNALYEAKRTGRDRVVVAESLQS